MKLVHSGQSGCAFSDTPVCVFFFSQKRHQMPALLSDSQVKLQIQSHPSSTSFSPTAEGKYRLSRMI